MSPRTAILLSVWSVVARVRSTPESLIYWLAAFEAVLDGMPMFDGCLSHPPAEQNYLIVDSAGKVEKSRFDILHLHADRIDLGDAFANPLLVSIHLGTLPAHFRDIHAHAAGKVNPPAQFGKLRLYFLRCALALDSPLQQRLQ